MIWPSSLKREWPSSLKRNTCLWYFYSLFTSFNVHTSFLGYGINYGYNRFFDTGSWWQELATNVCLLLVVIYLRGFYIGKVFFRKCIPIYIKLLVLVTLVEVNCSEPFPSLRVSWAILFCFMFAQCTPGKSSKYRHCRCHFLFCKKILPL